MHRKSILLLLCLSATGAALADSGDLFVDRREVDAYRGLIYTPIVSRFSGGEVKYKLTVPVVHFTSASSAGFYTEEALAPHRGPGALAYAELGDITVKATRRLWPMQSGASVDLGVKLQLATGNVEKGIGAGHTDTTLLVDLAQQMGRAQFLVGASYTARHSFTADAALNGFGGYLGVALNLTPHSVFDATYEYSQAGQAGDPALHSLSFALDHATAGGFCVRSYALLEREGAERDRELGFALIKKW